MNRRCAQTYFLDKNMKQYSYVSYLRGVVSPEIETTLNWIKTVLINALLLTVYLIFKDLQRNLSVAFLPLCSFWTEQLYVDSVSL